MAIRKAVARDVSPKVAGAGLIDVRNALAERQGLVDTAFEIVGALFASVSDRPDQLGVITGDSSGRPDVTVAGDFPAVVEVIEHAELAGQLVLVGRDGLAIHGE